MSFSESQHLPPSQEIDSYPKALKILFFPFDLFIAGAEELEEISNLSWLRITQERLIADIVACNGILRSTVGVSCVSSAKDLDVDPFCERSQLTAPSRFRPIRFQ
ncbi:MAG: hypothetical protein ACI9T8_000087 [Candidatus Saccharimonadales bacterium]|jgi:hypothetical protein